MSDADAGDAFPSPISLQWAAGLDELAEHWPTVAGPAGNIFATWEWISTWWRHFGRDRELRVALARATDGRPAAIVPLYISTQRPFTLLRFLGHGPGDWQGPIHAPADGSLAASATTQMLSQMDDWDLLFAEHVRPRQSWAAHSEAIVARRAAFPILRFRGRSWEEFLAQRSRNFRDQARRRERRLARAHELRYRLSDKERLDQDMRLLFALHAARWRREASGALAGRRQGFHLDFSRLALDRGWLRLWVMELDQRPVAVWYGFRYAGVEWYYQAGWDPAFASASVGFVLLTHTVRSAMQDGASAYWFLRGGEEYKARFAEEDAGIETLLLPRSVRGRLAAVGATYLDHIPSTAKEWVKKLAG